MKISKIFNLKTINKPNVKTFGRLVASLIIVINLYIVSDESMSVIYKQDIPFTISTLHKITFLVICFAIYLLFVRLPIKVLGITKTNIMPSIKFAILTTIPILGLLAFLEHYFTTTTSFSYSKSFLFNEVDVFYSVYNNRIFEVPFSYKAPVLYSIGVALQEVMVRGFIQGTFLHLSKNKRKALYSNLVATSCFVVFHVQASYMFAIFMIPLSLYWGKLFTKFRNIAGCIISHIMIGCWTLFALNFYNFSGILRLE